MARGLLNFGWFASAPPTLRCRLLEPRHLARKVMTITQLLQILYSRVRIVAIIWASCVLTAVVVVLLSPTLYSSSAQILVNLTDTNNPANVQVPSAVVRNYIATQVETLRSRSTALGVVEAELLDKDPAMIRAFTKIGDAGDIKTWISNILMSRVQVNRLAASDLISVTYSDRTPEEAQRFANAFANAFIRIHLEQAASQARGQVETLTKNLVGLRERLVQVETRRSELRRSAIESGDASAAGAPEASATLPSMLATARNTLIQARVAHQQAEAGQNAPSENPELQQLRRQLGEADVALARELPQLGPGHRRVLNLEANRKQLRSEIESSITRLRADHIAEKKRDVIAAEQRVEDLKAALLKEERMRDESISGLAQKTNLDQEIESLSAQVQALVKRREEARHVAAASQSNITLLAPATLPSAPSSPRSLLITGLAITFGLIFGIASGFLAEMLDRRVRCVQDITSYIHAPVLGTVKVFVEAPRMLPSTALTAHGSFYRRNRFADRAAVLTRVGSHTIG
jgi:polysaccharide biosynthesis transport protein